MLRNIAFPIVNYWVYSPDAVGWAKETLGGNKKVDTTVISFVSPTFFML
ncbi:MAG: hypothetical protein K2G02_02950 [Phocaeicola sp.]|nr:hypothetical protein [Phocaeicola sp.]